MDMLRPLFKWLNSATTEKWLFAGGIIALLVLARVDYSLGQEIRLHALYSLPLVLVVLGCAKLYQGVVIMMCAASLQVLVIFSYDISPYSKLTSSMVSVIMLCVFAVLARCVRISYLGVMYLATHDPLTKLHNRRNFDLLLAAEISRQNRYGGVFSLAILDLDDFKKLNDTKGHKAGDEALTRAALLLSRKTRASDTVARIGGDEFVILMPSTSKADCKEVCSQVVERLAVEMSDLGFKVTASVGSMTFNRHAESNSTALEYADRALYQAKANGRNCVFCDELQDR